ncbi:hypothetical protein SteCoe_14017 [Stentor coeruleus]|uniref:G-protein coupled receptors family 1 profile domain-containing protein n=1 Tax=Stentor coeruleus TaxID=5963 RepID=A0A1R2C740_9CILI|nr:hypothetical protein SteCoe_14017 [Stentor coeruleus]
MKYEIAAPFAALSSISCATIIILSIRYSTLRKTHPYNFVYVLAILDFFWVTICLIPYKNFPNTNFCMIQGFLNQFFNNAQMIWTGFISLETYNVAYRRKIKLLYGFNRPFYLIMGICLILAIIPLCFDSYKEVYSWCWIGLPNDNNYWLMFYLRLFCYFLVLLIIFLWNFYVNFLVYYHLRKHFVGKNYKEIRRLRIYPIIMIICYSPLTLVNFIANDSDISKIFLIIANCMFISAGFLNSLAYGCTSNFWNEIRRQRTKNYKDLIISDKLFKISN